MDIYAFRVIVNDSDTYYRVLGQMHSLYKAASGPRERLYRHSKRTAISLCTSMIGPHGVPVEVRSVPKIWIRWRRWVLPRTGLIKSTAKPALPRKYAPSAGCKSLLELQQSAGSSFEFIESVKSDLFPDEIYVFTPEGRIVELPAGATPVDFAYAVHTDIGHACVGARVDRQPYPLSQPLTSGQTVEIITAPGARPNAAWLNFVVSSKARAKIRQLLKTSSVMIL